MIISSFCTYFGKPCWVIGINEDMYVMFFYFFMLLQYVQNRELARLINLSPGFLLTVLQKLKVHNCVFFKSDKYSRQNNSQNEEGRPGGNVPRCTLCCGVKAFKSPAKITFSSKHQFSLCEYPKLNLCG